MVKFLLIICVCVCAFGCATTNKSPDLFDRKFSPIGSSGFFMEDEDVKILFDADTSRPEIVIVVKNKSNSPLKIKWDESAFIDFAGRSQRVIHSGIRMIDKNSPQAPSIVAPGSSVDDIIVPADNIAFVGSHWHKRALCGITHIFPVKVEDDMCVGKEFGLLVSVEKDGKTKSLSSRWKFDSKTKRSESSQK